MHRAYSVHEAPSKYLPILFRPFTVLGTGNYLPRQNSALSLHVQLHEPLTLSYDR